MTESEDLFPSFCTLGQDLGKPSTNDTPSWSTSSVHIQYLWSSRSNDLVESSTMEEGTLVAKGKHVVPDGVAVEELDGGKKKLADECPVDLARLLDAKGVRILYDKLVDAIVQESNTRNVFGKWKDEEFVSVLDLFADEFAEVGIKIALCKRSSCGSGASRWLEFIDTKRLPDYIPQYDVANYSGQVIKTIYCTLEFPYGVAVEPLKNWNGRKKLQDKMPIYVEKMMTNKGLLPEYDMLVQACVEQGVGRRFKNWKTDKLQEILREHGERFEAKGVALFLSIKQEYVSHGQHGGHQETFRWIEFVDREQQPDYYPQRDAQTRSEKCVIS